MNYSKFASDKPGTVHLRKKIEGHLFVHQIRVTASFGAAKIDAESQLMSALETADQRLYQAKNNGRNRVCFN
ncbi:MULTISPECIES: diguanylate cyclase domain-containing protein [unclassified Acinetobacter]|uniref:diguanylate cyclase domain-containing protein n=1 Tax=Acinetobacter sp. YH12102 TaxID=2601091 RepID=UPI00135C842B